MIRFVFTDGAYSSKTKIARIGVWSGTVDSKLNISETFPLKNPTSQRAEGYAIQRALEEISRLDHTIPVVIITDSMYMKKSLTVWYKKWESNGWKNAHGKPVKNQDIIQMCLLLLREHRAEKRSVNIDHISRWGLKSHQTEPDDPAAKLIWYGNQQADALAGLEETLVQEHC